MPQEILIDPSMTKAALSGNEGARVFKDKENVWWVGASAPVRKLGAAVITQQQRKEAYAKSIEGKQKAISIILIAIVLSVLVSFVFLLGCWLNRSSR